MNIIAAVVSTIVDIASIVSTVNSALDIGYTHPARTASERQC